MSQSGGEDWSPPKQQKGDFLLFSFSPGYEPIGWFHPSGWVFPLKSIIQTHPEQCSTNQYTFLIQVDTTDNYEI